MGIKGSSTRQVYFEDAKVPVENLLGEIHKGYKIAFNILNIGRLKLGAGTVGGARSALGLAAAYTTERKAFGKFISSFGMIQKKLGKLGYPPIAKAAKFVVCDKYGPLRDGEFERAREWGRDLRAALTALPASVPA